WRAHCTSIGGRFRCRKLSQAQPVLAYLAVGKEAAFGRLLVVLTNGIRVSGRDRELHRVAVQTADVDDDVAAGGSGGHRDGNTVEGPRRGGSRGAVELDRARTLARAETDAGDRP